jgi:hypothetical protein
MPSLAPSESSATHVCLCQLFLQLEIPQHKIARVFVNQAVLHYEATEPLVAAFHFEAVALRGRNYT